MFLVDTTTPALIEDLMIESRGVLTYAAQLKTHIPEFERDGLEAGIPGLVEKITGAYRRSAELESFCCEAKKSNHPSPRTRN